MDKQGPSHSGVEYEEDTLLQINPISVGKTVLELLRQEFGHYPEEEATDYDKMMAAEVFVRFLTVLDEYVFRREDELIQDAVQKSGVGFTSCNISSDESDESEEELDRTEKVSMAKKKKIVDMHLDYPNWSLKTLQSKGCVALKSKKQLITWKQQLEQGGTRRHKLLQINEFVKKQFDESREFCKIIKTINLQQWGMVMATELQATSFFKGSATWAKRFKNNFNICSRKVTHLVSKHEVESIDDIMKRAENFRTLFKSRMQAYPPYAIINTDQCGFAYELVSNRTLTTVGEKKVLGYAQSPKNLVTHSYTVQYTISAAGTIVGNVLLCLQEKEGKLGPRVEESLWNATSPNITLTCSRSGKLSTSLVKWFNEQVIAKEMNENFLYVIDSWPGHTNPEIYASVFGINNNRPEAEVLVIPEKCTPLCQPLDTTFHRQLKVLARRIVNHCDVFVEPFGIHPEDKLTCRRGVIKFQSLLHHQLSSPLFHPMIRYSFYSSGLTDEKEAFQNVEEVCFSFSAVDPISCSRCQEMRFIKCSHCRNILCFHCFYFVFHTTDCNPIPCT